MSSCADWQQPAAERGHGQIRLADINRTHDGNRIRVCVIYAPAINVINDNVTDNNYFASICFYFYFCMLKIKLI